MFCFQRRHLAACLVIATLAACPQISAGKSWDGGAGNAAWGSADNWDPDAVPALNDDILIGDQGAAANAATQLDADYQIASLELSNGGDVSLAGHALEMWGDLSVLDAGSSISGAGLLAVSGHLSFGGSAVFDLTGGTLRLDGGTFNRTMQVDANLALLADTIEPLGGGGIGAGTFAVSVANGSRLNVVELADDALWVLGTHGTIELAGTGAQPAEIAGSAVSIEGDVSVDGAGLFSAPVQFVGGTVSFATATDMLQLGSGTPTQVTIEGATVGSAGVGVLKAAQRTSLIGHGTIEADIDFADDTAIVASGGTLFLAGEMLSFQQLEAADGGTLRLLEPLVLPGGTTLELSGGTVTGGLTINSLARGYGHLNAQGGLTNNSAILARSQNPSDTLRISGRGPVDLDGTSEVGELEVHAIDLAVATNLTDDFNGTASVGAERTLSFERGWTLGSGGLLKLTGTSTAAAELIGAPSTLEGTVQVTGIGRVSGETTFDTEDVQLLGPGAQLELDGTTRIEASTIMMGGNRVKNLQGAELTLADGASLILLENQGLLHLEGAATMPGYQQGDLGTVLLDIGNASNFASLHVVGDAQLDGSLSVMLDEGYTPAVGNEFEILTTVGVVVDTFDTTAGDLPSLGGGLAWQIDYAASSVTLRVVAAGLPGDFNGDDRVDLADYTLWRDNLGAATEGTLSGNGSQSGGVDTADYQLWRDHYGESQASPAALSQVPEPASVVGLVLLALGWTRLPRR